MTQTQDLLQQAQAHLQNAEHDAALDLFSQAIAADPDNPEGHYQRGMLLLELERTREALRDLDRACKLASREAKYYLGRARLHAARGDWDNAMSDIRRVLKFDPNNADAYAERGDLYNYRGQADKAMADYNKALELNPNLPAVYYNRGILYADQQKHDLAKADYDRSLALEPDDSDVYTSRGAALFYLDDLDGAVADFTKAIELDAENARAYNNRAVVKFVQQKYEAALADYARGLELMPQEPLLIGGFALTSHALGKVDEARELWRGLLRRDRRYADPDWVGKLMLWPPPLVEETRKLLAGLKGS
ncbi:MAG: tetratricopeptide repeat protein [Anaerolineae bacterium]|nr:tetratricopeptide repeat protein [Anaerolineae bacterium]MDW8171258.1 tetratricopeptide repeat protein [Anaerolineae bacterium]